MFLRSPTAALRTGHLLPPPEPPPDEVEAEEAPEPAEMC